MADKIAEGSAPPAQDDSLELNCCRRCSTYFEYELSNGGFVKISVGIPPPGTAYKAISHVWGRHGGIKVRCKNCSTIYSPLLRSIESFRQMLEGAGAASTVWLDNLSIDQADPKDVATQVAVMGDIYRNAKCVLVFLPPQDEEAYNRLAKLFELATQLLERKWRFDHRADETVGNQSVGGIQETNALGIEFYKSIFEFREATNHYRYWSRAWTFQEWAVAFELQIICDSEDLNKKYKPLEKLKSRVVFAAIMMADYRLRYGDSSLMKLGFHRGLAKPFVDTVKRLFPFENAFAIMEEIDIDEQRAQIAVPGFGTDLILGLRGGKEIARSDEMEFRSKLTLALDSFASGNTRQATFDADRVACWTSMCGIAYEYVKEDAVSDALGKAIRSIRSRDISVYNFHVNGDSTDVDIDLQFFKYAASHEQSNSSNRGLFAGIPVFTGHTDTTMHFKTAVENAHSQRSRSRSCSSDTIHLKEIQDARITCIARMNNPMAVKVSMECLHSGIKDGFMFYNVFDESWDYLESIQSAGDPLGTIDPSDVFLVVVAIPSTRDLGSASSVLYAWAICSYDTSFDRMFVGRESLNGTLVLAVMNEDSETELVAYLVISDHESGTFLIKSDDNGKVDMLLRTPQRSDMGVFENKRDRRLQMQLTLTTSPAAFPDLEDVILGQVIPSGELVVVKVDKNAKRVASLARAVTQRNNDAALTACEPYTVQTIRTLAKMSEPRQRVRDNPEKVWTGLHGSIIGHSDVISQEQQMQDDILRCAAADTTDANKEIHNGMGMATIGVGRYKFHLNTYSKPSKAQEKQRRGSDPAPVAGGRAEKPTDIDGLLKNFTLRPRGETRESFPASQGGPELTDRQIVERLLDIGRQNELRLQMEQALRQ